MSIALVLGTVTLSLALRAQAPDVVAKPVTLEVASIKESLENRGGAMQMRPGGLFVATNIRVRDFINMAFRTDPTLLSQQIIDLPPWASTVRYNILARYVPDHDPAVGDTDSGPIVRALLDTRFAFKAHMEKRELPAYLLSVAPTGAKLRPAAAECSDPQNLDKCRTAYGQGRMTGRDMPFAELVREILVVAQRPVLDRTGISGRFDVDLQWNPDDLTDGTDSRPSIFGAVQELGLKLEANKALVDVLVVDHLERPTED
jgi:uncharacterized protein (TIGR03435 family)